MNLIAVFAIALVGGVTGGLVAGVVADRLFERRWRRMIDEQHVDHSE